MLIKASWVLGPDGLWLDDVTLLWDSEHQVVWEMVRGSNSLPSTVGGSTFVFDASGCAVIPGPVNAHTHLELSAFEGLYREVPSGEYFRLVRELMRLRGEKAGEQRGRLLSAAARRCREEGVGVVGDVANNPEGTIEKRDNDLLPVRHLLWEMIGFRTDRLEVSERDEQSLRSLLLSNSAREDSVTVPWLDGVSLVPHAVYSTSSAVIRETKRWCRTYHRPFSIHVGEIEAERRLVEEGRGPCREFLEELGKWDDRWVPPRVPPVVYLDRLGVLDRQSLLVHALHLDREEWEVVRARGCTVCLCPRSNHFLATGRIPAAEILSRNIPFLLGTDSLASSPSFSVFEEAVFLMEQFPSFSPHKVLAAVTGYGRRFFAPTGHLFVEPGYHGSLLAVDLGTPMPQRNNLDSTVLHRGAKGAFRWIAMPCV